MRKKKITKEILFEANKCWKKHKNIDKVVKCLKQKGYKYPSEELSELTLDEVGIVLGITRERVRQLETNAIRKIRLYITKGKNRDTFYE